MELYAPGGRRRVLPPLVFGAGVLWHLLRRGGRYDVVHTASFPYFSLLAAALVRPLRRFRLVVDWHEVWSRDYWREYLGPVGGRIGHAVQSLCLRVPQRAFCFSELHARRLRAAPVNGELTVLEGEYAGPLEAREPAAGRSRWWCSPAATSRRSACPRWCRRSPWRESGSPSCAARCCGDGPERDEVLRLRSRARARRRARRAGARGAPSGSRARSPGRSAWCFRPGARATGWS